MSSINNIVSIKEEYSLKNIVILTYSILHKLCRLSPLSNVRLLLKQSRILSLRKFRPLTIRFLMNLLNLPILLKASVSLLVPSSSLFAPDRFEAPKLERSKAKNRLRTCSAEGGIFHWWGPSVNLPPSSLSLQWPGRKGRRPWRRPTCSPTWTLSTPRTALWTRSWSCAWSQ